MTKKLILPILSVSGIVLAIVTVAAAKGPDASLQSSTRPAPSPYASHVSGSGIVEASTRNISIGSPVGKLVLEVPVRVGSIAKAGDVLFRLDDRDLRAELAVRTAALAAARAKWQRLQALPRAEETPALEARVDAAEAEHADAQNSLVLAESVSDRRAIREEEVTHRRFTEAAARARLVEARADLELHNSGAWTEDLRVAQTDVESADAQVRATETEIERMVVRAPMDGRVLQVNVRPGEYAKAGDVAHVIFGAIDRLHLRVDIDENDAWRFLPGSKARASVRSNPSLFVDLSFEYAEPYIIPKQNLNGAAVERVDTRVLQVVYSFERGALPIYVGQQMDVVIDAEGAAKP